MSHPLGPLRGVVAQAANLYPNSSSCRCGAANQRTRDAVQFIDVYVLACQVVCMYRIEKEGLARRHPGSRSDLFVK